MSVVYFLMMVFFSACAFFAHDPNDKTQCIVMFAMFCILFERNASSERNR